MRDRPTSLDEWNDVLWPKVFMKRLPKYLRTKKHSMELFRQLKEAEDAQRRKASDSRNGVD